jgi:hypothetical protein
MKRLSLPVIILVLTLAGCSKKTDDIGNDKARLTFRLTDAPASYERVNIDITGAQAIINGSVINLDVKAGVYNLLDFVNGKDTVIVDQEIPTGELSQIRLILGGNNSIMSGKQTSNLTTPSAQQSGLKLNIHETFIQGIGYEYVIDFDAARSIVKTGSGKFILKPVLKVFTKAVTGAIQGTVKPAKAKPVIYAINESNDTTTAMSDTLSGKYMLRGLSKGTYKVSFVPVKPYKDSTLVNISVSTGIVTKLDTLKFR